jgi:hypothetical protein
LYCKKIYTHNILFQALICAKIDVVTLNYIRSLYSDASLKIKLPSGLSNPIAVKEGVLQGDTLFQVFVLLLHVINVNATQRQIRYQLCPSSLRRLVAFKPVTYKHMYTGSVSRNLNSSHTYTRLCIWNRLFRVFIKWIALSYQG